MSRLIVISGCSGGGKSTLLSGLSQHGYTVVPEVGRILVEEQLAIKNGITPWQQPQAFCEMLITRSITTFHQAQTITHVKDDVIFFDRSFLEGISYYQGQKTQDAHKYDHIIDELRFYPTIFLAPPWQEIFCQDVERKHTFEDAVTEYERLLTFYPRAGYQMIELPKVSVSERIQFVIASNALSI